MTGQRDERVGLLEITTFFAVGGTERQVVNLANGIDRRRFDVHLACHRRSGLLLDELDTRGRPVAEYPVSHLYGLNTLAQQAKLAAYVRRNRIRVVHAHDFYTDVFAIPAARLAGAPVVVSSIRDLGDDRTPLQALALRAACWLSDAVVVNAGAVRSQLIEQGYAANKIHVIANGIDLARFAGRKAGPGIRQELGIPADAPLVAVISRMSAAKGIDVFLEAAAAIAARHPRARFLLVGGGNAKHPDQTYQDAIRKRAGRADLQGRVFFTGYRLDVPEILSQVTVAVLPSLSEALSNSLLEAMAAGAPVVATRVGGTAEALEHGRSGWTVRPGDAAEIAEGVCKLLDDPGLARALGEAGRARVEQQFSLSRMIGHTQDLYLELLGRALRRPAEAHHVPG